MTIRSLSRWRLLPALALAAVICAACSGDAGGGEPPRPWSEPPGLAVDLRLAVEPREVALLQPITITLDRFRQAGVEVAFAPEVDGERFRLESSVTADERAFGDGRWQRTTLVVRPLRGPGELVLPSFVATAEPADGEPPAVATTPETVVTVTSLLGEHGAELEAPGDPFPAPFGGWWWIGGGCAAVALLWWLWRRSSRRRDRPHAIEFAVPAHVKALRELTRLRGHPRATPAEIEAFYVGTSHVLRVYLEERFGLHAPERTTEEFLRDLESGDELAQQHRRELERFLSQCDLVKFAAVRPSEAEHATTWALAQSFVESTRPDRVAAPAPQRQPVAAAAGPGEGA